MGQKFRRDSSGQCVLAPCTICYLRQLPRGCGIHFHVAHLCGWQFRHQRSDPSLTRALGSSRQGCLHMAPYYMGLLRLPHRMAAVCKSKCSKRQKVEAASFLQAWPRKVIQHYFCYILLVKTLTETTQI